MKISEEPLKIKKNKLQYACDLRDLIQTGKITQEQAQKMLDNPLILL